MIHTVHTHVLHIRSKSRAGLLALAAIALFGLGLPAGAAAGPALDEYTLDIPDPSGPKNVAPEAPQARPESLPPSVRGQLSDQVSDQLLVEVATARELAAPSGGPSGKQSAKSGKSGKGSGGERGNKGSGSGEQVESAASGSVFAIAGDAAGGGGGALLLGGLVVATLGIALVAALRRAKTRRSGG